ncbi:MAG: WD40 repeat domain-containing protein [Fimbriiglobus sp.]
MLPFVGHKKGVQCVGFSRDSGTLVSGGRDGKIIVWDRFNATPKAILPVGYSTVSTLAFHPDSERFLAPYRYSLAMLESPHRLRFWDVATGSPSEAASDDTSMWSKAERLATGPALQEIVIRDSEQLRHLAINDTGSHFVCHEQHPEPALELWQLEPKPKQVGSWLSRRADVTCLVLSGNGRIAAVASKLYVRVGPLLAGRVPPGYAAQGHVKSLALNHDGSILAGSWENRVTIWQTNSGEAVRQFDGHTQPVEALAYRPDGEMLASGGQDGYVLLWEPESGHIRARYDWNLGAVHALAFSPDCLTLAVAGDGGLMLFDLE